MNSDGTKVVVGVKDRDTPGYSNSGAAYIYTYSGGSWDAGIKIVAFDGATNDEFGRSVSMSGDGTKVIVGAWSEDMNGSSDAGSAYIFTYDSSSSTWDAGIKIPHLLYSTGDKFGWSVDMSSDGTKIIVGAPYNDNVQGDSGAAYTFTYDSSSSTWGSELRIKASDAESNDYFGDSVAMSGDGNKVIVGAHAEDPGGDSYAGSVYIFTYDSSNSNWGSQVKIDLALDKAPNDYFGWSVAMSGDGNKIIVGARDEEPGGLLDAGSAYIFTYGLTNYNQWDAGTKIVASDGAAPSDHFGYSVAMNSDGTKVVVGAFNEDPDGISDAGSAYIFTYSDGSWDVGTKIVAPDKAVADYFGRAVSISGDGNKVIVGADQDASPTTSYTGSASIFDYQATELFDASTQAFTATGTGIVSGSTVQLEGADGTLYSVVDATSPNAAGTQVTFKMGTLGVSSNATVANQPYKVRIDSTSGLIGTSTAAIGFAVGWTSPAAGADLNFDISGSETQTLVGTDGGGGTNRTFSVAPGSNALPAKVGGGTLDLTTTLAGGAITGQIAAEGTTPMTFRLTDNATGLFTDREIDIVGVSQLYAFTSHTFTSAGMENRYGPTISNLQNSYGTTGSTAWVGATSPAYLTVPYQGVQEWTVPISGTYRITMAGARGGTAVSNRLGGNGRKLRFDVTLQGNEKLSLLIGQSTSATTTSNAGGGGGTFIIKSDGTIIAAAGGGGGASANNPSNGRQNAPARSSNGAGNKGEDGNGNGGGLGGVNGGGGHAGGESTIANSTSANGTNGLSDQYNPGGAGVFGDGGDSGFSGYGTWTGGEKIWPFSGVSGRGGLPLGGFGGGAGGNTGTSSGQFGGGGGGGYSGGGGGASDGDVPGGGGGSFINSSIANSLITIDTNSTHGTTQHGYVTVEIL
jgi:hypothetical protein